MEALKANQSLQILDLSNNFLDTQFAVWLADLLRENPCIHTIDIGKNPIDPEGAEIIKNVLREGNDSLGSLGDLNKNTYMGIRAKEDIQQMLDLNNAAPDKKKFKIAQM